MMLFVFGLAALVLAVDKVRNEHRMTAMYERQAAALERIDVNLEHIDVHLKAKVTRP
jgi:hypothetical protein